MTLLPQLDCCTLLGIDPKTLRQWVRQAHLQFVPHPTDARLKCLTQLQVQQLAAQHARPLPWPASTPPGLPEPFPAPESLTPLPPCADSGSLGVSEVAALTQQLARLERSVTTIQEQMSALVLEVAHDRQRCAEQRLSVLEALVQHLLASAPLPPVVPQTSEVNLAEAAPGPGRRLLPAEVRARSRVTPLIEYGAQGCYVLVCPREGTLPFAPDSPEWFDWLATLTSFRFVGQQGRFSAHRDTERGQRTRSWRAYRTIHQHAYKYYLGTTDHLTLAALEQAAATLQAYDDAL
jgi:hypothetical protein